eukprot:c28161_g1_i2 orf=361-2163(-)
MERKKKREKPASNGVEGEHLGGQGDAYNKQRDTDQQGVILPARKVQAIGSSNNDTSIVSCTPPQPFVPAMNWPYVSQQHLQQTTQLSNQTSQAQLSQLQTQQQQQQAQQGQQGGAHQGQPQLPPAQQPSQYWPSADLAGPATGAGQFYPLPHPGSQDSNSSWHPSTFSGTQCATGNAAPFSYPGGYGFPPAYSGFWDPSSWWMHNAHQQALYPFSFPGYGSGYGLPPTPTPVGAFQRGFIKPPAGLSQKHQRVWEAQSMENMQLWAALARAESEISCQRNMLAKLEADMQAIKSQQDAAMEASALATAVVQPARRSRRKKSAQGPVAIVGLPAPEPVHLKVQSKKPPGSRATAAKNNHEKVGKEDKVLLSNHFFISLGKPDLDQGHKDVAAVESERKADQNLSHVTVHQSTLTDNRGLTRERGKSEGSCDQIKSAVLVDAGIERGQDRNVVLKESIAGSFPECARLMENRGTVCSQMACGYLKVENTRVNGRGDSSGTSAVDCVRNSKLETRTDAHYNTGNLERFDSVYSEKAMPGWDRGGDISEELDEVIASGQEDDEDADDDEDTALEEMSGAKVDSLGLDSASSPAVPKQMMNLSRW